MLHFLTKNFMEMCFSKFEELTLSDNFEIKVGSSVFLPNSQDSLKTIHYLTESF